MSCARGFRTNYSLYSLSSILSFAVFPLKIWAHFAFVDKSSSNYMVNLILLQSKLVYFSCKIHKLIFIPHHLNLVSFHLSSPYLFALDDLVLRLESRQYLQNTLNCPHLSIDYLRLLSGSFYLVVNLVHFFRSQGSIVSCFICIYRGKWASFGRFMHKFMCHAVRIRCLPRICLAQRAERNPTVD